MIKWSLKIHLHSELFALEKGLPCDHLKYVGWDYYTSGKPTLHVSSKMLYVEMIRDGLNHYVYFDCMKHLAE